MNFLREHTWLRIGLMAILFAEGIVALLRGLSLSGQLLGVIIMLVGLGLLLMVLWIYNKQYTDDKSNN